MELVTGAMGSLLPKLGELLKEEYNLQEGVRAQIQSLTRELEIMHVALRKVAEVPHEQLDELVKLWARDVRELLYDMEDVVDTHLVRMEDSCEATPNPNRLKKLMKKMGNLFSKGKARHQIADAIQDINKQIQEVANRRGRYTADNIVATPAASTPIDPRLQALYREATELVGIDGKRDQELIKMLSEGDDVSKKKLKIVSVVGFGGLGKTTLAKAVYDKIKGDFDCSAFVSVGRNPGMKKVFMDILLELDKKKHTKEVDLTVFDERMLIDVIREFLKNKRGCLEGGHKKKGANEGSNEGGNDGEGDNVNAKGKKMIRGPVTCKRCGEMGHRQASSKCPLNGTKRERKRQPRKNSTKAKPGELSTPQRPTREQILQDSPGRMTRSRLAFLLGEGSSAQTSTATPERMPTAAASKKITPKRKLHIG